MKNFLERVSSEKKGKTLGRLVKTQPHSVYDKYLDILQS